MARVAASLLLALAIAIGARGQLVIEDAKRQVDLTGFVVRVATQLTVRNDGKQEAASLLLCESQLGHLAFLEAEQEGSDTPKLKWAPELVTPAGAPAGAACREFTLAAPLKKGGKAKLKAYGALTHVLRPEPAEVAQRDPQHVLYQDAAQLLSPYKVEAQTTELKVGSGSVESFTEVAPSKRSGRVITYGPYADATPWSAAPISVHFENNAPFAAATSLEREVQVSHWGAVYFEERYSVRHVGARVAGEWSRFDLQQAPRTFGKAGIPSFSAVLPTAARDLYFRDAIGNISSSETRRSDESVMVNLQPRYPLFGGWSCSFTFGWTQPLASVVGKEKGSGRMAFSAPLGPSVKGLVVDELTIRVVLPEGARDPRVETEVALAEAPAVEHTITYLDLMGRPVVLLRLRNVVNEMSLPLQVTYTYSSLGLLQKPLLLAAAFGSVFATATLVSRGGLAALLGAAGTQTAGPKAHAS